MYDISISSMQAFRIRSWAEIAYRAPIFSFFTVAEVLQIMNNY
jgi:hypothetical protein